MAHGLVSNGISFPSGAVQTGRIIKEFLGTLSGTANSSSAANSDIFQGPNTGGNLCPIQISFNYWVSWGGPFEGAYQRQQPNGDQRWYTSASGNFRRIVTTHGSSQGASTLSFYAWRT